MKINEAVVDQKLYVELDCLLDTRIGVIQGQSSEIALEVLVNGFNKRFNDNITKYTTAMSQEKFKELYTKRTVDVLINSRPTQYLFLLRDMVSLIKRKQTLRADIGDITVTVNYYPYKLEEDEIIAMEESISSVIKADVTMVYLPNYEITLEKISNEGWVLVAIYDGNSWVERITNNFAEDKNFKPENVTKLPRVTMNFPALLRDNVDYPTKQMLTTPDGQELDIFESIRLMFVEIVSIDFLPPELFSLASPNTPAEPPDYEQPDSLDKL